MLLLGSAVRDQGWPAQVEPDSSGQRRNSTLGRDQVIQELLTCRGGSAPEFEWPADRRPSARGDLRLPFAGDDAFVLSALRRHEFALDLWKMFIQPRRPLRSKGGVLIGKGDAEVVKSARRGCRTVTLHGKYYNLVVGLFV